MIPLSYSRLTTFESCPSKFDYLYMSKLVKDAGNEHTEYGVRVHEALEKYGLGIAPLTEETKQHKGVVDAILGLPGEKYFEYQMAIDAQFQPCDWFAPDVWFRGIADVLVINDTTALIGDYKTGKIKDDPTQVKLFACLVFAHFPAVTKIKTALLWLKFDKISESIFHRKDLKRAWDGILPRIQYVHETVALGVYPTRPSGLCPWCPAKHICPDARIKK